MAKIINLNNEKEWCYECKCGNAEFYAITTEPKRGLFIGFQCTECEKITKFETENN